VSVPARWTTTRFSDQRKAILFDESLQGLEFCQAYAGLVDGWLTELLGDEAGVALVAVGGYGRSELAPCSDLDLMLVHPKRRDVADIARRIWYPIWEEGISLDHSVKTIDEAMTVAKRDLKSALGLLDARTIAGDEDLGRALGRQASENWRNKRERWITALGIATDNRHRQSGDVAFLLEPDLKDGRGGLRDVHALRALLAAVDVAPPLEPGFNAAAATLLAARVALHRKTRKATERLLLQEQDGVAHKLGLADADHLMQQISSAARTISWTSDDTWHRVRSHLAGPSGRVAKADRLVGPGVVLRDNEVIVAVDAPLDDASLPIRIAGASAATGLPIARASLERLRAEAVGPGDPWTRATLDALIQLLATGPAAIPAFEALDQYDLISRLLPEWEPVRCRRQHNPYHRFTVDRHLLEAVAEASRLSGGVSRPDLLLVAAWLHDLGKGYPGDHTDAGVDLMQRIAARMGFTAPDVEILTRLVREHLLLAETATRRDVADPATLTHVAQSVHDFVTLQLLAALTEADSRATGETAWTTWKASLITELVDRVSEVLAGQTPEPKHPKLESELQNLVDEAAGGLLIRGDGDEVVIVAPDRPGLFCQLTGTLALQGLDVLAADVRSSTTSRTETTPKVAVDVFRVQPTRSDPHDWTLFETNLRKVIDGRLALEARLAERARSYRPAPQRRAREISSPQVTLHNEASDSASVIEVRAGNTVGVLHRIARAFLDLYLDIRQAKVQTIGDEVVDTFYVVDQRGAKVQTDEQLGELRRAVLFELSRPEL
jgi:[protein-PII] uridylyltransferase